MYLPESTSRGRTEHHGWRKLAECTSSHDVTTAFAHFWQKVAADYWLESGTMSKLLAGINETLSQAQTASLEAATAA